MVECMVCNGEFKRITKGHLNKHGLNCKQYKERYPNACLISEESKLAYSNATKAYFKNNEGEAQRRASNRVMSIEGLQVRSDSMKKRWKENKSQFITVERNEKIAKAKKDWWAGKSKDEKSAFVKDKIIPKVKERLGDDVYKAQLREKGLKGYQTLMFRGRNKLLNKFEEEMVNLIKTNGYECITQFEIDKWFYDSYIPELNLIIEFDGDYWHPRRIEDCTNQRLKKQWFIDRKKEHLAKQQGYNLIRIRESEKHLLIKTIQNGPLWNS